ncbi:MAG: hypothetical protein KC492_33590, partial [Myxococcales bacterium]|nr:hypothetical protein [Myxococcales bacterium]
MARQALAVQGEALGAEAQAQAEPLVEGPPALQLAALAATVPREPLDLRARRVELAALEARAERPAEAPAALPEAQLGARQV